MPDNDLNINIRATDQYSGALNNFKSALDKSTASVENIGRSLRTTGREIGFIGSSFVLLGTSITAPLALAYNASAKYSAAITKQIYDMKETYTTLQVSIGEALIPVMKQFNDILKALIDRWNQLSPAQQQHLVQMTFLTGEYILFGGIALKVIGETMRSIGDLIIIGSKLIGTISAIAQSLIAIGAANPILLVIGGSIVLIVGAMLKWKEFGDLVCDALQKIGDVIAIIVRTMVAGFEAIHGGLAEARQQMAAIKADWNDLISAKAGQHGTFANAFDNVKLSIGNAIDGIHNFSSSFKSVIDLINGNGGGGQGSNQSPIQQNFFAGFQQALETSRESLNDFFTMGQKGAQDMVKGMQASFSSFFNDFFTGQLKTAQDYFVTFGNAILKIFSDMLSQMITAWITSGFVKMFGSIAGSIGSIGGLGGQVSAFGGGASAFTGPTAAQLAGPMSLSSFDIGTDYVPYDQLALIHKGEKITPANRNNGASGGGVNITIAPVITAWDASDILRNKQVLTDIIAQSIVSNGQIRQLIKQYGN